MARRDSDGRWIAEWREGYGRGAPRRTRRMPTKAAAETLEDDMRVDQRRGEYVAPADMRVPFRAVADDLVAGVEDESTRALYESRLRLHVLPVVGDVAVGRFSEADVDAVARALIRKGLAPSYRRGILVLVAMVLRRAQRRRLAPRPPQVPLPEVRRKEIVVLTPAQARQLLDSAAPRGRAAIAVGLGCGLRQGEVLGLTVSRVDFLRRRVRVEEQIDPRRPGERKKPKTATSHRTVPLPRWVADELAAHLATWPSDDLVFRSARGQWRGSTWNRAIWKPALAAAGLPATYGFHVTRHFYVASLIDRGRPAAEIQRLLGHASLAEMDTYAHLFPTAEAQTRAVLDDLWDEAGTRTVAEDGP
jgi:integrase